MDELRIIFRSNSDIEARIVRGLLETHGITSLVSSAVTQSVFPLSLSGLAEVRVSVRADEADEAQRIIASHREEVRQGEVVRMHGGLTDLEDRLGYTFRDRALLEHALTHRSRAHEEATGDVRDNESLEFLGDALLGFVVAEILFRRFPELDEGQKSKIKASLVSTTALARVARRLGVGSSLLLGRGEERSGGRTKQALLADAYEAVLAAVYLDGGFDAARRVVLDHMAERLDEVARIGPGLSLGDYKSALQEWLQSHDRALPEYGLVSTHGPDHAKVFEVEVSVSGESLGRAQGRSKKEAEQRAAREALDRLSRSR